ncbi:MAG: TIGR02266 family protein [Desulfatibacillaceae bacterium]|nr:TIGR02266 family protein [Desulfatibacillaceae bacterium]
MILTTCEETYEKGQIIFEEGSSGDWIYFVESGAVELSKSVDGKPVVVSVLREGELFGELAFIGGFKRTATAKALDNTVLGILDRSVLDEEYNRMSEGFRLLVRSLAVRLKKTTDACVGQTSARRDVRKDMALSLSFKSREALVKAQTLNLSKSGLFVKTPMPLPVDTYFELNINLPDHAQSLTARAVVRWIRTETNDPVARPVGMGVEFTQMSDSDRKRLNSVLSDSRLP